MTVVFDGQRGEFSHANSKQFLWSTDLKLETSLPSSSGHEEKIAGSSDRAFGLVFTVVFLLVACAPLLNGEPPRWWALGVSASFLIVGLLRPILLRPANRLWTAFGLLLHRITSPVVLGFLFFCVITPVGLFRRIVLHDPLGLKREPECESYWTRRSKERVSSMTRQF